MKPFERPIPVLGAGAVSAHGIGWRGLGGGVADGTIDLTSSQQLALSHPNTLGSEVTTIPDGRSAQEKRARKLMSRSAVLATVACDTALADAEWHHDTADIGFYLGVGASGGSIEQLEAMLDASIRHGELQLGRFGVEGLRACSPLFAFQLMNNFTLCHSAIMAGTQGPNAALFSRGGGTVTALQEAAFAILDEECDRALAGGSDSCLHPVTWAELRREGYEAEGLVPGEGAALIALAREAAPSKVRGWLEYCDVENARNNGVTAALDRVRGTVATLDPDLVVTGPWGAAARDALSSFAADSLPELPVVDISLALGNALAATPALAWISALDLMATRGFRRALVLSVGIDHDLGVVVLRRGEAP